VSSNPETDSPRNLGWTWFAGIVLALAGWAAYARSFSVPFIFDDDWSIADNGTIRRLWPLWRVLVPPPGAGVGGRPLLNLSFALNYAWSGQEVWSYHVVNLIVHVLAALTLYGLVRRSWVRAAPGATPLLAALALAVALLWELHPLQTESVTYVVGRAEAMMGLFYFSTLYGFVRYAEKPAVRRWAVLSVAACFLGTGSKEVMVSAPVLVLLYDRTFFAGSFASAWRQRRPYYLGLAASWLLLLSLLPGLTRRAAGVSTGIPWSVQVLTNFHTVVRYIGLAVWPHPLVLDYGLADPRLPAGTGFCVVLVLALLGLALWSLRRPSALGFLLAGFFLVLAPTTSFVPLPGQPMAEHRMYLPLAAVITGGVLGLVRLTGLGPPAGRRWLIPALAALALGFGLLTSARNRDYRDGLAIWEDTVAKAPANARAHNNLATFLDRAGRHEEAWAHFRTALQLSPHYVDALANFGGSLRQQRQFSEAVRYLSRAAELKPDYPEVQNNLAEALIDSGDRPGAIIHLRQALALEPGFAVAEYNLGNALRDDGKTDEAIAHYQGALRLDPDYPEAHNNLGVVLGNAGRVPEALEHLEAAVRLRPAYPEAQENLGKVLIFLGRESEGQEHLQRSIQLRSPARP